jgi:hypothetical protein
MSGRSTTDEEIKVCTDAMIRAEPWSSFWDRSDAEKLVKAVLHDSERYRASQFLTSGDARLIAAAPEMLEALRNVQKLISEAAMTGFNCHDGNWAERLFLSQQVTSAAIKKATASLTQHQCKDTSNG